MKAIRSLGIMLVLGLILGALAASSSWSQEPTPPAAPSPAAAPGGVRTREGDTAGASTGGASSAPRPQMAPRGGASSAAEVPETDPSYGAAAAPLANLRIAGSALRPRASDVEFMPSPTGGCVYATAGASRVWNVPLYLPQGTNVQYLRMYYNDTSSADCSAWLTAYDLYGQVEAEWRVASTGDAGEGYNTSSVISHTIDYTVHSYVINWRPSETGSDMQLCGFRVLYRPAPFDAVGLPLVWKSNP